MYICMQTDGMEKYPLFRDAIDKAMAHWQNTTCIRFRYRRLDEMDEQKRYLLIVKGRKEYVHQ